LSSKFPAQRENSFSPTDSTRFDFIIYQTKNNDISGRKHWRCAGQLAFKKELLRRRDDAEEKETI
jgi:hypothetical protein